MPNFTKLTSGALVYRTFNPDHVHEGHHVVVIAGQHAGTEPGPVFGLHPATGHTLCRDGFRGLLTVVPCANPHGFMAGTRENEHGRDSNRGFQSPMTPEADELWSALCEIRRPTILLDLHSAYPGLDLRVLYHHENAAYPAQQLADHLRCIETGWIAEHSEGKPGCLTQRARAEGALALVVEFAGWTPIAPHEQPKLHAEGQHNLMTGPSARWRSRDALELSRGVWSAYAWARRFVEPSFPCPTLD